MNKKLCLRKHSFLSQKKLLSIIKFKKTVRTIDKDNRKHKRPNIHVWYQGDEVVLSVPEGDILEGGIPNSRMKIVNAWIEIHKDELLADWKLAVEGQQIFKIDPLK